MSGVVEVGLGLPKRVKMGRSVIWGIKPIKPICNVPADALKVRVRLRNDSYGLAFVKFADRIEKWTISPKEGQNFEGPDWQLSYLQSVNFSLNQKHK